VVHVRCPANAEDAKSSQKKLNHQLFISEVVDEFLLTGNPGDMRFTGSYNRPFGPLLCKVTPLPPMRRGKNYEARLEPGELKGRSFGAALPIGLAVAAGASATYFAATSGSESDDAPGGGNNPSFGNVLGTYNFNGSVQQRGACNFNNFQSRVTFSGSQDALNADLLEALLRAYRGTARPEGSGFQFNTSASGTVPSLGSYTGTLIGVLLSDGTATATETLNFPCGTVTIAQSGRKQ
jgi:hypothetical protein